MRYWWTKVVTRKQCFRLLYRDESFFYIKNNYKEWISMTMTVYDELVARGLVAQVTDEDELK